MTKLLENIHRSVNIGLVNEMKMNPDIKDKQGDLPIHDAIRFNHLDVVQFLSTHTNSRIRNMLGEKPVDTAISSRLQSKIQTMANALDDQSLSQSSIENFDDDIDYSGIVGINDEDLNDLLSHLKLSG